MWVACALSRWHCCLCVCVCVCTGVNAPSALAVCVLPARGKHGGGGGLFLLIDSCTSGANITVENVVALGNSASRTWQSCTRTGCCLCSQNSLIAWLYPPRVVCVCTSRWGSVYWRSRKGELHPWAPTT